MKHRISTTDRLGSLARQSLRLDIALLADRRFPGSRLALLVRKYSALIRLAAGRVGVMKMGPTSMIVPTLGALGTLQSTWFDVQRELATSDVLGTPSPVVVDVGANIGQFSLAVRMLAPAAEIIAIEADPHSFEILDRNLGNMDRIRLVYAALGSSDEIRAFYRHRESGVSSFIPRMNYAYAEDDLIDIHLRPLDSLELPERIDLLKIDVEGYELEVLKGGIESLGRTRYLLVEMSLGRQLYGGSNLDLLLWIRDRAPGATIARVGRPLLGPEGQAAVDLLIDLGNGN